MSKDEFKAIVGGSYTLVNTATRGDFLVTVDPDSSAVTVYRRTSPAGQRPRFDEPIAQLPDHRVRCLDDLVAEVNALTA